MHKCLTALLLTALLLPVMTHAADETDPYEQFRDETNRNEFEFDERYATPWVEQQARIPVLNLEALQPLDIDHGPIGASVYIDETSVDVNLNDRVVRYWMVLKNNAGDYGSMTYEGLRCGTQEYKTYGYASARRPSLVKRSRQPAWRAIRENTRDPHHEMARDYFCAGAVPRKRDAVLHALRGYGNINPAAGITDLNTLLDN